MITVLFQTETHFPVSRRKIRQAITEILDKRIKRDVEIGVSIVGDRRMKDLNKKFRKTDTTTDVLSFGLNDPTVKGILFVDTPDNILRLGDIIVSYPQAVLTAAEENKLVDDVVNDLVLHGLNHLLGIHHEE